MKSAKEFWCEKEKAMIDKMSLKLMVEEKVYFANEMWEFAESYHAQFSQAEVTDEDIKEWAKEKCYRKEDDPTKDDSIIRLRYESLIEAAKAFRDGKIVSSK
jgi:hypothetical protein